ncbi:MAG: hypothetical protein ACOC4M_02250, partial [Promethearchaeia archaeon]
FQLVTECPQCHKFSKYDKKMCQSCGTELKPPEVGSIGNSSRTKELNYCPNCGIKLPQSGTDIEKCPNCKAPIKTYL